MQAKRISVRVSDGSTIRGKVNIGDRWGRLSDWLLNNEERFLVIFDADIRGRPDTLYFLNKDYIIWINEEEE